MQATINPIIEMYSRLATTYDDDLNQQSWWVRIEGQFVRIPADKREACNREVRDALLSLAGERGIRIPSIGCT